MDSGNYLSLLLVFLSLLLLCSGEGEARITIQALSKPYTEDENTTFSCHVTYPAVDDKVIWMIRDPQTKAKIFYSYSMVDQSPLMKLDEKNETTFTLLMRRDFEGKQLLCETTRTKLKTNLTFTGIKQTIPIEKVVFRPKDLIHGKPLRLFCDVEANPKFVKLVDFRGTRGMALANDHHKLDTNKVRYILTYPQMLVDLKNQDGQLMQCFAAKDGFKKATGNVMSQSERLVVHYFKLESSPSSKKVVVQGKVTVIDFTITCNPAPQKNMFFVTTNTSQRIENEAVITNASRKYLYNVNVAFTPPSAAEYDIFYNSNVLERPKAMTVGVAFREPDSSVGINTKSDIPMKHNPKDKDSKSLFQKKWLWILVGCVGGTVITLFVLLLFVRRRCSNNKKFWTKEDSSSLYKVLPPDDTKRMKIDANEKDKTEDQLLAKNNTSALV